MDGGILGWRGHARMGGHWDGRGHWDVYGAHGGSGGTGMEGHLRTGGILGWAGGILGLRDALGAGHSGAGEGTGRHRDWGRGGHIEERPHGGDAGTGSTGMGAAGTAGRGHQCRAPLDAALSPGCPPSTHHRSPPPASQAPCGATLTSPSLKTHPGATPGPPRPQILPPTPPGPAHRGPGTPRRAWPRPPPAPAAPQGLSPGRGPVASPVALYFARGGRPRPGLSGPRRGRAALLPPSPHARGCLGWILWGGKGRTDRRYMGNPRGRTALVSFWGAPAVVAQGL